MREHPQRLAAHKHVLRALALTLVVVLFVPYIMPTRAYAASSAPELTEARSAIVTDQAGNVLWSKNAHERLEPASITKIMTAMVALDSGVPLSTTCDIVATDLGADSQTVGYVPGDTPSFEELLLAMLVFSGNDAAVNVACTVSGTEPAFAQLMNQKAAELGMTGTHFVNAHGLEVDGHYTTANDLVVMGRYAMEHYPFIAKAVRMESVEVHAGGETFYVPSTDDLMPIYEGLLGIKTGAVYAGTTFLGASKRGNVELYTCVLGCDTEWGRFEDTMSLMEWAYASFENREIVDSDWTVRIAPYALCFSQKCRIGVTESNTASVWPSQLDYSYATAYSDYGLPVDAGTVVGVSYQRQDGRLAGAGSVSASQPVSLPAVNPFALPLFESASS